MSVTNLATVCFWSIGLIMCLVNKFFHIELLEFVGRSMQLIGYIIALNNLRKSQK